MQMERVSVDAEHALAEHALAERLLSLIEMHIGTPLTVEETASALFMSRASLQRFCKRTFGIGTAHLWERLRLEHAAADSAAHPARGRARARRRRACAAARAEVLEGERLRIQLRLLRKGARCLSDASAGPQPRAWLRAGAASLGRVDLEQVRCHRASVRL